MSRLIGIGMLVLLGALCIGTGKKENPADRQLVELTTRHAQQQAAQNERLAELQQQWQTERTELYRQRDHLETQRNDLAVERQRDPVIAHSIDHIGTLALGLLPLAVCVLLLRRSQEPDDTDAIAETLVADLVSEHPVLLAPQLPAAEPPADRLGSVADKSTPYLEPPAP